jgi:hypothetical protein
MRTTLVASLSLSVAVAALLGACKDDENTTTGPGGAGTGAGTGTGGGLPGKGVGDPCAATEECRTGLACESGKCAPGHSLDTGSPCTISGECKDGLFCGGGVCAPAGMGTAGDTCTSDADCASGFRCGLVGFGAQCVAEGAGDVGDECTTSGDCFGGLACLGDTCGIVPPGTPPFGLPWPGVECAAESGPVQAYFRVPRGTDDGDFYRLPHPNDVRLTAGKPDLSAHPTPGSGLLGYDVVDRYLRAVENEADGWGLYHSTFFRFSGRLDSATLKDNVHLVNLTNGSNSGLYYSYSIGGGSYICPNWIAIRRAPGAIYEEGATYAAYMTTAIKADGGAPVSRSTDLDALLGATAPADPILAAQWPKYASFRAYLAANTIDPSTVLTAAVFTTGHPRATVEKLATSVAAAAPPVAASWVKCGSGTPSPCPDATGDRACPTTPDPDFDELHALVSLPIYQSGTAPYLDPADGGDIQLDGTGTPQVVRTEQVCMSLTVPKSAPPVGGYPTVVYAHGTGGNFRSHVTGGVAKDFAKGVDDGTGTIVAAAVLGIDQVQHGPRRGSGTASPNDLFFNFANPAAARGNPRQGAADQMALLRFVPTVTFDAGTSPTGVAFSLAPSPAYWGHSQGATEGAIALPYGAAWSGAVLSGAGGSLIDAMLHKTSPVNIAAVVPFVLSDVASDGTLVGGTNHPVLSVLQTWIDPADPLSYARLASKAPPAAIPAHHLFQPYGQGDTYAPPETERAYAIGAALGLVAHDASVATPDDIAMLPEIPTPASGNLTVNAKVVTAVVRQYRAGAGKDGHFVAFDVPSARADVERFLAGAMSGIVPRVGQ